MPAQANEISSALMLSAHPPGTGTGSAVRGQVSLDALRERFDRVDAVSLAFPDEAAFADAAVHTVPRPPAGSAIRRRARLLIGGDYYREIRSLRLGDRLRRMAAEGTLLERYDLVWCHAPLLAEAGRTVPARAYILDIDNVPSADWRGWAAERGGGSARRAYYSVMAAVQGRAERRRADLQDRVIVTSDGERTALGDVRPPVLVVPNTVPPVPATPVAETGPQVLFVGSLDYAPNIDAVSWLADEIVPRLLDLAGSAVVKVVGRNPVAEVRAAAARAGIDLVADAPSLAEHYAAARVVLAPMRSGGGTGRIKVLEALAHGVPVVATGQAVAGIDLTPGRDFLVGAAAEDLARETARLLADPAAAAAMGEAGRAVWRERHDPAAARRAIGAIVDDALGEAA